MKKKFLSSSAEDTIAFGAFIGARLEKGDKLALSGDLGGGKTTISKGIISVACGEDIDNITSPTFVLVHSYKAQKDFPLYHIDLYRITSLDELDSIDWYEYAQSAESSCIIEWADRAQDEIEQGCLKIEFEYLQDNMRLITLSSSDKKYKRFFDF